ncbi:hypothetical protein [Novosphingobium sp. FKTRR1]|nr:hypothetical protein [Novosphingobium sp. FKTRR1]
MRPQSIIRFEQFYVASIVLGLLNTAINFSRFSGQMSTTGVPMTFMLVAMAIGLLINVLFLFFIARRASNIARWIFVAISALGLVGLLSWPKILATYGPAYFAVSVLATLLNYTAVAFLFRRDAVRWLRSKGQDGPVNTTIFE